MNMSTIPKCVPKSGASRNAVVTALGLTQILGYGTTFYLLAVLALPISTDTGWSLDGIAGGLSIGMFVAGLAAPAAGRAIDRYGGRPVLAAGSVFFAIGLLGLGSSTHLFFYWLAWGAVGLGMAAGLYDAAFSALGCWYRDEARAPISAVALWGGFASTLCWPLSTYLVATVGWRWTCMAYAGLHLFFALPLHSFLMPRGRGRIATSVLRTGRGSRFSQRERLLIVLIATSLTLSGVIVTLIAVHLIPVLQERGFTAAAAVSIGALIGPSQVAGRFAELAIGKRVHPVWSTLAAALLMVAGILLLNLDMDFAAVAIVAYAIGAGVSYIVRGTLPLVMFGPDGYAALMGKLAFPSLIAQALAPWLGALVRTHWDTRMLLLILLGLTAANLVTVAVVAVSRRR